MNRPRLRRFAQGVIFAHLLASPLLFSRVTTDSFELPKVALLVATTTLLGSLSLVGSWHGPAIPHEGRRAGWRSLSADPVGKGFLLFGASGVLSTVASISPLTSWYGAHESFAGLVTVLAYTLLFFATRSLFPDAPSFLRLLWAPTLAAGAAAAYGLVQLAGLDPFRWERAASLGGESRVFATLGHANLLGGYLAMCLPIAVLECQRALERRRRFAGLVAGSVTVVATIVAVSTFSRAAWLALAAALLAVVVGYGTARPAWRGLRMAVAGGVLCVCALIFSPLGTQFRERLDIRDLVHNPRLQIWKAALALWREFPILGSGLDTFGLTFPRYRTPEYALREWGYTPLKAHNEVLQVLSTQGLVGLAALAGLLGAVALVWRHARAKKDADGPLLMAVAASLAAFLPVALFGFTVSALGTLFVTLAALVSRLSEAGAPDSRADESHELSAQRIRLSLVRVAAAALTLGLLTHRLVYRPVWADVLCRRGLSLAEVDSPRAQAFLRAASALRPNYDVFELHFAATTHRAARRESEPAARSRLLEDARAACERALALVPARAEHHANLGRVLGDLARQTPPGARPGEAYAALERAIALDPSNAALYADASSLALLLGDPERARGWAERCLVLYPDFGPSLQHIGHIAIAKALGAGNMPEEKARLIEEAVSALSRSADGAWHGDETGRGLSLSDLSAALLLAGRPEGARAAAQAALQRVPGSVGAQFNLARSYELMGDRDVAIAHYRSLLAARPDYLPARHALAALAPDR